MGKSIPIRLAANITDDDERSRQAKSAIEKTSLATDWKQP